jgi:hypothetical protein
LRLTYATPQRHDVVGQLGDSWPGIALQNHVHGLEQDIVHFAIVLERDLLQRSLHGYPT